MSKYDWSRGPAELDPHSLAKHTILREYIERYVSILTRSGAIPSLRITLIDGFAGGGEYFVRGQGAQIHDGSPLILINAVRAAVAKLDAARKKPIAVDANFVFIEKEHDAYEYLRAALPKRFEQKFLDEKVQCIRGSFEDQLEGIIKGLRSARGRKPYPIFVLDQYGYSDVPIEMIARIMSEFSHAEVFLTLAVDNISAFSRSLGGALRRLRSSLRIDTAQIEAIVGGRMAIEEIEALPEEDRNRIMSQIQCVLHEAFAKHAGAKCYTPFFITSTKSHRSYWFLHLANNARANDVVKDLHWETANHFKHHGRPGTNMLVLGVDPSKVQLSFDFGDSARTSTLNALIQELPVRLREEKYRAGVSVNDLYADLCNETPASKGILKHGIDELCAVGELKKRGADDEERRLTTGIGNSDIVQPAKMGLLFSIPHLRNPKARPRKR